MVYLLFSFVLSFLFCVILYICELYIGLFLFLSIFYFLLLVLNIWSCERILAEFCLDINNCSVFINKIKMLLYSVLVLFISPFVFCLFYRLFVIINNISVGSFVGLSGKFIYLNICVIISILFVTVILSWLNVYNKKAKDGVYSVLLLLFSIFGSLLLFINILLFCGFIDLSLISSKLLLLSFYISIIFEFINNMLYLFIMGDVYLVNLLELSSFISGEMFFVPIGIYSCFINYKSIISNFVCVFWYKYCVSEQRYLYSNIKGFEKSLSCLSRGNIFQRMLSCIINLIFYVGIYVNNYIRYINKFPLLCNGFIFNDKSVDNNLVSGENLFINNGNRNISNINISNSIVIIGNSISNFDSENISKGNVFNHDGESSNGAEFVSKDKKERVPSNLRSGCKKKMSYAMKSKCLTLFPNVWSAYKINLSIFDVNNGIRCIRVFNGRDMFNSDVIGVNSSSVNELIIRDIITYSKLPSGLRMCLNGYEVMDLLKNYWDNSILNNWDGVNTSNYLMSIVELNNVEQTSMAYGYYCYWLSSLYNHFERICINDRDLSYCYNDFSTEFTRYNKMRGTFDRCCFRFPGKNYENVVLISRKEVGDSLSRLMYLLVKEGHIFKDDTVTKLPSDLLMYLDSGSNKYISEFMYEYLKVCDMITSKFDNIKNVNIETINHLVESKYLGFEKGEILKKIIEKRCGIMNDVWVKKYNFTFRVMFDKTRYIEPNRFCIDSNCIISSVEQVDPIKELTSKTVN